MVEVPRSENERREGEPSSLRRRYERPVLTVVGSLEEMTAGGTGDHGDMMMTKHS